MRMLYRRLAVAGLLLSSLIAASGSAATREQVEADWQRQDQARLNRIRRAGTIPFPQTQLRWPGLQGSQPSGLVVPGLPAPVLDGQPVRLANGAADGWQIVWPKDLALGFGRNRLVLELRAQGKLDLPMEVTVESVVFTRMRPVTQPIVRKTMTAGGPFPVEFQITHEGAAAVIVTARQGGVSVREGRCFLVAPLLETIGRAERLAADFGVSPPEKLAKLRTRAEALDAREKTEGTDPGVRSALCNEARWTAREIAFANPLFDFDRLLLIKRFTQETYPDVCLNHMPWVSRPGGDLCVVTVGRHDRPAEVRNLLDGKLGPGHVHGADL